MSKNPFGNMGNIMRQAQAMQDQLARVQEQAATKVAEGSAGGGMVTVKANGAMEIVSIAINPDVLTKFTEETGIAVTLDTYSSNEEMLAKIQAGATGYDIVFPSVHMNDIMLKLGLLEKTGINQSADFANIDPAFLRSKEDPAS